LRGVGISRRLDGQHPARFIIGRTYAKMRLPVRFL
jgi:hypothetical protein